jgi:hypothetical protein
MSRKSISTLGAFVIIGIAILIVVAASQVHETDSLAAQRNTNVTNTNTIQTQRREVLVQGSFVVEPGHFNSSRFEASGRGVRVEGRFRAQGGSGNDIEVYIVDEDGFENYRNGHNVPTYYNSGRVTVGRINVNLGEGVYYIIFNNQFAVLSNKAVTANIDLIR